MKRKRSFVTLMGAFCLSLLGCGTPDAPARPPACSGKCDGFAEDFIDTFQEVTDEQAQKLAMRGVDLQGEVLNQWLGGVAYLHIELKASELYMKEHHLKDLEQQLTLDNNMRERLNNLDQLTAGLAAQFGDDQFVTKINKERAGYLASHPDQHYAQAHFKLDSALNPYLGFGDEDGSAWIGYKKEDVVTATVVTPVETQGTWDEIQEVSKLLADPLEQTLKGRGWVFPQNMQQIKAMAPGESITLTSAGRSYYNLGVNIPFELASLASGHLLVQAKVNLNARLKIDSEALDIQRIRTENAMVVDIGVKEVNGRELDFSVKTGYGLADLPAVMIAGRDLVAIGERSLTRWLDRKLPLASVEYSKEKQHLRHVIARFRFNLDKDSPRLQQALYQALKGDARLAQHMAKEQDSGVAQLMGLDRHIDWKTKTFGLGFFGLMFAKETTKRQGSVTINDGNLTQQILFDELKTRNKSFFGDLDPSFHRRAVSDLFSHRGRPVDSWYNIHLTMRHRVQTTHHQQILAHVDPLLIYFLGDDFAQIDALGDEMEQYVLDTCKAPPMLTSNSLEKEDYINCLHGLRDDATLEAKKNNAIAVATALAQTSKARFANTFEEGNQFIFPLLSLKLSTQYRPLNKLNSFEQPGSTTLVDLRLDGDTFEKLLGPDYQKAAFDQKMGQMLLAMTSKAGDDPSLSNWSGKLHEVDDLQTQAHGQFMHYAPYPNHHILVTLEDDEVATVGERKLAIATSFVDALNKLTFDKVSDRQTSQVVTYALLNAANDGHFDLLASVDFDNDDNEDANFPEVFAQGSGAFAALVEADYYDLDRLLAP